jgi:hypothetical protein
MESNITPKAPPSGAADRSNPQSKPITVDVPEDRVDEFHAFFERFLAGPGRRERRGRHGRPGHHGRHGHGHHGHGCSRRTGRSEQSERSAERPEQSAETTQTTEI